MISIAENKNHNDEARFANVIFGLGDYYGKTISPAVVGIYWGILKNYEFEEVDRAIKVILSNPESLPFMPKASEIIAAMPSKAGASWLSADEAWAHVVSAYDENNSVVFPSDEAQKAWHQAAQPIFSQRDQSPARMAFRAAYDRLVNDARAQGIRPKAKFVAGFDPALRIEVANKYIALGVLVDDDVPEYIALAAPEITAEGRAIAGLLGFDSDLPEKKPSGDFMARLNGLKAVMKQTKSPEEIKAEADALKRADMERRRQEAKEALRGQA